MKLKLTRVIFLNLCFRVFLLLYLLKEDDVLLSGKSKDAKALKHWLDPLSKRVVLVFINGLGADFLNVNATPFLQEMLASNGSFGVALTGKMQTNYWGMKTVLSGRTKLNIPYSWIDNSCHHSILDYIGCKCGTGNLPQDLPIKCNESYGNLTGNFSKIMSQKTYKSCLLVMSYDLDPITVDEYSMRLKKIDDDLRSFATHIDSFYGDNKTTYIVTSARGTPVGDNIATDAPVVVWGNSILHSTEVTVLKQNDIAAMLCALLGISFPPELTGVIPMNLMDLHEYHEFELTLYTIRHYENVLGANDLNKHLIDSSELEVEQLFNRLDHILFSLRQVNFRRTLINSALVLVLLSLWGVILTTGSFVGYTLFFVNFSYLFLLLVVVCITLVYSRHNWELMISAEILTFWIYQNWRVILSEYRKNFGLVTSLITSVFSAFIVMGIAGNRIAIPLLYAPVVLWPFVNGAYKRLNSFVIVSQVLSGFSLGILPFSRVFSEEYELFIVSCISFVFVCNYYFLFAIFKRKIHTRVKVTFAVVSLTTVHLYLTHRYNWSQGELSLFLLAFSLLSASQTFGTVLERLLFVYLSLFIPVLMLSIKYESVFYFAMVFHTFTWIFVEYHGDSSPELLYHPSVFTVEPKKNYKSVRFSTKDIREIIFYLIYSYTAYFAVGHLPDLHSYDLYVLPAFVYKHPKPVSYFLAVFKFILPFFITTTSFLAVRGCQEKSVNPMITMSVWISDVISCFLILFSQFVNKSFMTPVLHVKFSHFIIQQCATISAILSYYVGKHLLFGPERDFREIFRRNKRQQQIFTS